MAVELASAYVTLLPSFKGGQAAIAAEMGGPAAAAGKATGTRFGTNFAKAGAVAGAAAIGKGIFDFTSFERGLNEVFTLIPDAGDQAFDEIEQRTKSFAKEFGVLPTEVIPSLYDSLSAGVPRDNVFDFLEQSNKLAKAGATDLGTSVDALTSVVNAYGAENITAAEASDLIFSTVRAGKTTVDELGSSLFQVTPIAASLGVGFGQVSASMATLTAVTGNTGVASTQLKAALAELGKDGSKAFVAFEDATGKTFPEFIEAGGTLGDGLLELQEYAEANDTTLANMFGSVEAGQAALTLAADGAATFSDNLAAMDDAAGSTQQAFEQMESGIGPVFDKLKAQFAVALIDLGDSLAPAIEIIGQFALTVINAFTALPGPIRSGIVIFATFAAAAVAFAGPAAKLISSLKLIGSAFSLLAANPWTLIIIAAVAAVFVIVKYWDEISAALVAAWEFVADKAVEIWNAISGFFEQWWPALLVIFTGGVGAIALLVAQYWDEIKATVEAVWNAISGFFEQWWPALLVIFTGGVGAIALLVAQYWDEIWAKTQEVWNAIVGFLSDVWSGIAGALETYIVGPVRGMIDLFSTLPDAASTAWNGVRSAVESVVNAVVAAIDRMRDAASNALGPLGDILSKAGRITDLNPFDGSFLGFDSGGVVPGPRGAPVLALVHGGETILPTHKPGSIQSLEQLPGAATTRPGDYVYMDFRGLIIRDDADLDAITRTVNRKKSAQGRATANGGLNW